MSNEEVGFSPGTRSDTTSANQTCWRKPFFNTTVAAFHMLLPNHFNAKQKKNKNKNPDLEDGIQSLLLVGLS